MAISHPGLKQGDVLDGKYVVRHVIGQGGMGSVFLADQPALHRQVAIKVLHPELAGCPVHGQRIRDEAVTACHVRSPHCLTVIDCSVPSSGASYLVMEYVPGRALGRILAEESISLARTVELFAQILSALGAVHDSGIVHADVKSDNFLVETIDGGDRVTLIDFGLARFAGSGPCLDPEDGTVVVSGTPEYMAPEVARGAPPTRASDLYAAGVILYELLTGATPFAGGTPTEIIVRHVYAAVVPPSVCRPERNIPPALDRVVLRALDKRPEVRFPDAATFARELRAAVATSRPSRRRSGRGGDGSRPGASLRRDGAPPSPPRIARGSDCGGEHRAVRADDMLHGGYGAATWANVRAATTILAARLTSAARTAGGPDSGAEQARVAAIVRAEDVRSPLRAPYRKARSGSKLPRSGSTGKRPQRTRPGTAKVAAASRTTSR